MKSVVAFCSMLLLAVSASKAAVIDFESAPLGASGPLTIDGFTFSATSFPYSSPGSVGEEGGNQRFGVSESGYSSDYGETPALSIVLTRQDSGAFAYFGADIATFSTSISPEITVSGVVAGGGFAADPIGTGDWLNLEQVTFTYNDFFDGQQLWVAGLYVDNVNVSAVPVPAGAWLFGSALTGLGWLRRRQTAPDRCGAQP